MVAIILVWRGGETEMGQHLNSGERYLRDRGRTGIKTGFQLSFSASLALAQDIEKVVLGQQIESPV